MDGRGGLVHNGIAGGRESDAMQITNLVFRKAITRTKLAKIPFDE